MTLQTKITTVWSMVYNLNKSTNLKDQDKKMEAYYKVIILYMKWYNII